MKICQITHTEQGAVDVLALDGALDSYSFPRFDAALGKLREGNRSRIVLDCARLDYINSAALGAVIGFARRAREDGGDLKLAGLSAKVLGIIDLLGFDKILHILPDVPNAVTQFGSKAG